MRRRGEEVDVVTGMVKRNLHHLLSRIFLGQSDRDLAACREVCCAWWTYLRNIFWRDPVVRRQLDLRLEARWRSAPCSKVQVEVLGAACKKKCAENFRECRCLERLKCAMDGNLVALEFGGCTYSEVRREGEGRGLLSTPSTTATHRFQAPQFQVSLHLGLGLKLDTSSWLSSPVFMSSQTPGEVSIMSMVVSMLSSLSIGSMVWGAEN